MDFIISCFWYLKKLSGNTVMSLSCSRRRPPCRRRRTSSSFRRRRSSSWRSSSLSCRITWSSSCTGRDLDDRLLVQEKWVTEKHLILWETTVGNVFLIIARLILKKNLTIQFSVAICCYLLLCTTTCRYVLLFCRYLPLCCPYAAGFFFNSLLIFCHNFPLFCISCQKMYPRRAI